MTTNKRIVPAISDVANAPFIFFDEAPNFGYSAGIVAITVAAYRHMLAPDQSVSSDLIVTSHLRCSIAAARSLRAALDKALLLAEPVPERSS